MKLPKQAEPVMRNAVHSGQISNGIRPSKGDCCGDGWHCPWNCLGTLCPNSGCSPGD